MRRVDWRRDARAELRDIFEYLLDRNPTAAVALLDLIEAKVDELPENPFLYRSGRLPGTHEMMVHPNYLVIYAVTDTTIDILRVLHSARKWP